jgi:hypothetical protein
MIDKEGGAVMREMALELIDSEDDLKYRRKYARPWKAG